MFIYLFLNHMLLVLIWIALIYRGNWNEHQQYMLSEINQENATHYENTPIQIYWKFYHQK